MEPAEHGERGEAPPSDRPLRGILALAGAALFFSGAALCAKLLRADVGSPQIVFLRSAFMVVVVASWAFARRELFVVRDRRRAALLLVRGLLGTIGFLLFFGAIRRIPLADTVILFQSHPAVVALVSPWLLGERLRPAQIALVAASICGVALVLGPTGEGSWAGRAMALGCAVSTGFALSIVRILRRDVPALTVSLAFPVVAVATVGPALALELPLFGWEELTREDWAYIGAIAFLGTIAQVLLTVGLGCVPAARGTAISNLQVVFAIVLGLVVLGETPSVTSLAGAAVIVTCLVLLQRGGRPSERATC